MKIADGAERLVRIVGEIVAWTGLAMVLLIAFNVIARYFFSYGLVALQELEWHLMAVGALFGITYALNRREEVRVDVLYARFPQPVKLAIDALGALLLGLVALKIAQLSVGFVTRSYALGEGSADPGGLPARYALKAMIPTAFVLLAIQAFARLVHDIAALAAPRPDTAGH
ncbi:TRAP transporter small permease subunit [Acuticoccus sp. I52.16.1]|uniref:TRAP transporter small permease subunit n=1 Tax=Acuticoccus sp. I52.16.1 TaxID=2928472 RepID=UPI001FD4EB16|nr:TRAP transporter small permease subunit [Acuticoccus sp. I52.16.1]UOM35197.1 TRAP transporter small permease subunit [Acuticoccus sp. I52.16.1]